jgi:cytochrome oxidase Cu insertion factor (SCO1/SenC/PrrC family)
MPAATRTIASAAALLLLIAAPAVAEAQPKPAPAERTGLAVGAKAPKFSLKDQNGAQKSLDEFLSKGRLVALVFYRSADW